MAMDDKGWKASDSSWLDLEEKDYCHMYHVNIIMPESDTDEDCMSGTDEESINDVIHLGEEGTKDDIEPEKAACMLKEAGGKDEIKAHGERPGAKIDDSESKLHIRGAGEQQRIRTKRSLRNCQLVVMKGPLQIRKKLRGKWARRKNDAKIRGLLSGNGSEEEEKIKQKAPKQQLAISRSSN